MVRKTRQPPPPAPQTFPASAPRRWVAAVCLPAVVVAAWYGTFLAWDFKTRFNGLKDLFGGACLVAGAILIGLDGPWFLAAILMITGLLLPLRRGD